MPNLAHWLMHHQLKTGIFLYLCILNDYHDLNPFRVKGYIDYAWNIMIINVNNYFVVNCFWSWSMIIIGPTISWENDNWCWSYQISIIHFSVFTSHIKNPRHWMDPFPKFNAFLSHRDQEKNTHMSYIRASIYTKESH